MVRCKSHVVKFKWSVLFDTQKAQTVIYIFYYVLNDLVIIVTNLVIDICLVHFIKTNLRQKLENKFHDKTKLNKQDQKKLKEEEKKKTSVERKVNTMIVLNVIIYLFCRLPELAAVFFAYFVRDEFEIEFNIKITCHDNELCEFLSSTAEYFYMLSYIFNIFLYYNINQNFKKGFRNYFGIKMSKKEKNST